MLTLAEIKHFMDEDASSAKKSFARVGQRYYEGDHDINSYRLFYWNDDGNLVEDKYRSNIRISHPYYTELVDQGTQLILSGKEGFIRSDIPELQKELDAYFNDNEEFCAELAEVLTGGQVKGFDFMYAYKNREDRTAFQQADSLGVVEIRAKDTDDGCAYVIYWYVDRIDKGEKRIKRIQVWDAQQVHFFVQVDDGEIIKDDSEKINPRPHAIFEEGGETTYEDYGLIPFFRFDGNKQQISSLKPIKPLIDDYDLMASSLSNNLVDFDTPIHVVKGYNGENLDKLQTNLKTKKVVGVDAEGGIEVHTVDVPFEARKAKLELDEKNIYRFGMGLNTSGLKDTNATTNLAIEAAYSLLELRCIKLRSRLKQFLRGPIGLVLKEINTLNGTDYQQRDVYFEFEHEIMSNALENAQVKKMEAETKQIEVNTILNVAANIGDEEALRAICEVLDLAFDEIKDKVEQMTPEADLINARKTLESVVVEDEPAAEIGAGALS